MTLALVEIPVAALLAVVVVGESLTMNSYLGLVLIFLCVIVLTKIKIIEVKEAKLLASFYRYLLRFQLTSYGTKYGIIHTEFQRIYVVIHSMHPFR